MTKKVLGVIVFLIILGVALFPSTRECPNGPCMGKPEDDGSYSLYYNTKPLIFRLLSIPVNYSEGRIEYNVNEE